MLTGNSVIIILFLELRALRYWFNSGIFFLNFIMFTLRLPKKQRGLCYSKIMITARANFCLQFMETSSLIEKTMVRYKRDCFKFTQMFAICIPECSFKVQVDIIISSL